MGRRLVLVFVYLRVRLLAKTLQDNVNCGLLFEQNSPADSA